MSVLQLQEKQFINLATFETDAFGISNRNCTNNSDNEGWTQYEHSSSPLTITAQLRLADKKI